VTPLVMALPGNEVLAGRLASALGWPVGALTSRRFPDGETYLRIDSECAGQEVVLFCTLDRPDEKVLHLLFLADGLRELGATRVGLVAPYLAYLRQDCRFQPGEAVTSRTCGRLISQYVDWLVTVDPHLHRYPALDRIYSIPTRIVHAAPVLAAWIREQVDRPVIVGPDDESEQWVNGIAGLVGAPHVVLHKVRRGDRDVEISLPNVSQWLGHTPVVVDDIVSSARTMIETVRQLVGHGLRPPVCVGIHGLFAGDAAEALRDAGAGRIVTTNSVPHPTNGIDMVPLVAAAVRELGRSRS
jgi:ribose-phosphate pyrophosphokinase